VYQLAVAEDERDDVVVLVRAALRQGPLFRPQDMASMTLEEMLAIGSVITAMPVVNAIPAVIAARPGVVTYADLPTQASRHVPRVS
jgi:hypothetical protein